MNEILEALSVASIAHKNQVRKGDDGAPYINHLIEVAFLLSHVANIDDANVLQAAVLHDILEDTEMTRDDLLKSFNLVVVGFVEAVTDDKTLSLKERRQIQIEHMSSATTEVKLIKLADHCSNIASIPPKWNRDRISEYLKWSYDVASKCFTANSELAALYNERYSEAQSKFLSGE